jgi:hypothetical protein
MHNVILQIWVALIGAGVYKGFSGVLAIPISEVVGQVLYCLLVQCTGLFFLDC